MGKESYICAKPIIIYNKKGRGARLNVGDGVQINLAIPWNYHHQYGKTKSNKTRHDEMQWVKEINGSNHFQKSKNMGFFLSAEVNDCD